MKFDIVRAWKDASYRSSLSAEELNLLPASPAGEMELSDAQLATIQGAHGGCGGCGCFSDFQENSSVVNTVKAVICNNSVFAPIDALKAEIELEGTSKAACNSFTSGGDQNCNRREERDANVI